jgi:hypothetical protein
MDSVPQVFGAHKYYIMAQKQTRTGAIRIRDYSEPLQSQRETTSYGERLMHVASFDNDPMPLAYDVAKYENEMIKTWRDMAKNPYIDFAIDDIVNEMLANDDTTTYPLDIDLTDTEFSDNIKTKIHDEFFNIQKLLQFNKKSYTLLRDWYIDGRAYFFVEFSKNGKEIVKITPLDPVRTKKLMDKDGNTTYIYQDIDLTNNLFEISEAQMIEVYSGLMDDKHQIWVSYLNKAFVPLNQVNSIEDALIIYRLTRAPERRVFYIDVGELPKSKAEQYMREIINNYRNRMEYDSATGTIKEKVRHMSMCEDIWLARRDGSGGTEVSTLQGGTNLGETSDLDYFVRKLFRALNIPYSRWNDLDGAANVLGRTTEISRDEVKYNKFIVRLRQQYDNLFYSLLRAQLDLKKIVSHDELDEEKENIQILWNSDNMFSTFKLFDVLNEKSELLEKYTPLIGKFVSIEWVQKTILRQTDEEIKDIEKQIKKEKKKIKLFNPDLAGDDEEPEEPKEEPEEEEEEPKEEPEEEPTKWDERGEEQKSKEEENDNE